MEVPGTPCLTAWANSGKSGRARREQGGEKGQPRYLCARKWVAFSAPFSSAQVFAHEARPRIGRPRQQGRAGGIGCMAYEAMVRICSEENLNSGKIVATSSRAGQIIQRKSIDQREQTQTIEETISNHREHREHGEGEHTRCSQGGRGNHAWGQTRSGDCDTGQPPACGDSRLLAVSAGLSRVRRKDAPGS